MLYKWARGGVIYNRIIVLSGLSKTEVDAMLYRIITPSKKG